MSCITRKAYYRQDGTYVRSHQVCQKKKVRIGPLVKGDLTQFGFHFANSAADRRVSLHLAIMKYNALSIFRKLNAIAVLQKNRNPTISKKAKADANWIRNNYM